MATRAKTKTTKKSLLTGYVPFGKNQKHKTKKQAMAAARAKARKDVKIKPAKKLFEIETREELLDHRAELMRRREVAHYEQRYTHALQQLQTAVNELTVCITHEKSTKERNSKLRRFLNTNLTDVRIAVEKMGKRPALVNVLGGVLRTVRTIK